MTENEKLRALLAEARREIATWHLGPRDPLVRRIDAALAEPVVTYVAGGTYPWVVDDEARVPACDAEKALDEARAEVESKTAQNVALVGMNGRLQGEVERMQAQMEAEAKDYTQDDVNRMTDEMIALRKDYEKASYLRGAEAMREAAAREVERQVDWTLMRAGLAADIRDLPVPEDKP